MHLYSKYSDGSYIRIEELDVILTAVKKCLISLLLFFIFFYYLLTDSAELFHIGIFIVHSESVFIDCSVYKCVVHFFSSLVLLFVIV
jgi:hypothetical protein